MAKSQKMPVINFLDIEDAVTNPEGEFYYPKLMERYNTMDSTLNLTDFAYIYYGFTTDKRYLVNQPSEKLMNELMDKGKFEEAIAEC